MMDENAPVTLDVDVVEKIILRTLNLEKAASVLMDELADARLRLAELTDALMGMAKQHCWEEWPTEKGSGQYGSGCNSANAECLLALCSAGVLRLVAERGRVVVAGPTDPPYRDRGETTR